MTHFSWIFNSFRPRQSTRPIFLDVRVDSAPVAGHAGNDFQRLSSVSPGMTKDKSIDQASETHSFPLLWMITYPSIDYDTFFADL